MINDVSIRCGAMFHQLASSARTLRPHVEVIASMFTSGFICEASALRNLQQILTQCVNASRAEAGEGGARSAIHPADGGSDSDRSQAASGWSCQGARSLIMCSLLPLMISVGE